MQNGIEQEWNIWYTKFGTFTHTTHQNRVAIAYFRCSMTIIRLHYLHSHVHHDSLLALLLYFLRYPYFTLSWFCLHLTLRLIYLGCATNSELCVDVRVSCHSTKVTFFTTCVSFKYTACWLT